MIVEILHCVDGRYTIWHSKFGSLAMRRANKNHEWTRADASLALNLIEEEWGVLRKNIRWKHSK